MTQYTDFIGNFYLVANSTENAKKYWDKALELDPQNEAALYSLAAQYFSNNDFAMSEKYWRRFLEQEPESIAGYMQLGLALERQNKNDAAIKAYDELLKIRSDTGEAYVAKARVYETTGRMDLAVSEYEKVLAIFPDNIYVLIYLGRAYYLIGDMQKSQDALLKVRQSVPDDLNAAYWLGAVYERLGQIDQAIEEFEFITKSEENLMILAKLGYFYAAKRNFSQAEKYFLKALNKDPLNGEIMFFLALTYMDDGKFDKAIQYFSKLTEINPQASDAFFFLGNAYDKKGDFANAEKNLLKAIELNPEHLRAMNYLGYLYADKNINLEKATEMLEKIVMREPQNGAFLDSLGWLYYRLAQRAPLAQRTIRFELAQRVLLAGVNLTRDPIGYEHLGDAYTALNNHSEAWVLYYLSYEASGGSNKEVEKKIAQAQAQMTQAELFSKLLYISQSHFLKLVLFRGGYDVKAQSGIFSRKTYISVSFIKDRGVLLEFPGYLFADTKIYIKEGRAIFEPKAVRNQIEPQILELIDQAAVIFTGAFYSKFENAQTSVQGNDAVYNASDGSTLIIDMKTALIKKIIKDDMTIEILGNKRFFTSRLPSKIKITSKKLGFSVIAESQNFSVSVENIPFPN